MRQFGAFPMAQRFKNPPEMQEIQKMQVCSLSWDDYLEEGKATL